MSATVTSLAEGPRRRPNGQVERVVEDGRRLYRVHAAPHIRLRMKRVFGKVSKAAQDFIEITDTLENSRDLLWFMERYPLSAAPDVLAHLRGRSDEHVERASVVERILSDGYEPPAFELALPPRDYQRVAASMVLATGGLLVADDLGVGKTVEAICTFTDPRTLPALVVTMTSLQTQWRDEIAKFAPRLRTHILKKGTPYDIGAAMRGRKRRHDTTAAIPGIGHNDFPDVIICNYAKLSGWSEALAGRVRSVVFDEVQELRIPKSDKYKAAKHIAEAADFRSGYSATPIYNYGGEMFHVLNVLRPGALGDAAEFAREWVGHEVGEGMAVREPRAFGAYLRSEGLMLRRTRAEVGRELPALTKVVHHIDADEKALEHVQGNAAELARLILAGGPGLEKGDQFRAGGELDYLLRQATGIAKAPFVAEFVRLLVESGEKVLLFGWHHEVYRLWGDLLRDLEPVFFTGRESVNQKDDAKRRFVEGRSKVLVMSLRAGAGLDGIQKACRTVVFGELDWSPAVHDQGLGRPHRDGQTDPVTGYFLVSDVGSDPVIAEVLGLKRAQAIGIRDPDAALIERMESSGGHIRRLAEAYLEQRGLSAPKAEG